MSKSKRKKDSYTMLDAYKKLRKTWEINPKTRVKDSDKKYKRGREKQNLRREIEDYS